MGMQECVICEEYFIKIKIEAGLPGFGKFGNK
jgi:hypothetical protein